MGRPKFDFHTGLDARTRCSPGSSRRPSSYRASSSFGASRGTSPRPVWKSNFGRPRCLRSCVCSMAWSFQAIDATLSPRPRRFDGVEVHKGPRNISQDNLTHWLISTQATTLETHGHFDAVQAYLHRLVQHHAAVLSLPQLRGPLATLAAAQRAAAARFRGLVHENLCLLEVATAD